MTFENQNDTVRVTFRDVGAYETFIERATRTLLAELRSYAEAYPGEDSGESFSEYLDVSDPHDPFQRAALDMVQEDVGNLDLFKRDNPADWGLAVYFSETSSAFGDVYYDTEEHTHAGDPLETVRDQAFIVVCTDVMTTIEDLVDEYRLEE